MTACLLRARTESDGAPDARRAVRIAPSPYDVFEAWHVARKFPPMPVDVDEQRPIRGLPPMTAVVMDGKVHIWMRVCAREDGRRALPEREQRPNDCNREASMFTQMSVRRRPRAPASRRRGHCGGSRHAAQRHAIERHRRRTAAQARIASVQLLT